jgi:hypothetical protein
VKVSLFHSSGFERYVPDFIHKNSYYPPESSFGGIGQIATFIAALLMVLQPCSWAFDRVE